MNFSLFGKVAGALALTVALAGCIDVTMDIEVQSETAGKATMTSVMGKDFYAMVKASAESSDTSSSGEGFCEEDDGVLTELPDGSAQCVQVKEGQLSEITEGGDGGPTFTVVSPGVVRVGFKTTDMTSEITEDAQDEETKAMMAAFFEGHFITMRVGGKRVTDTNMTLAADGASAEVKIPFLDLINGTADVPEEFYAVVDTN
jgi:hypothetical protein